MTPRSKQYFSRRQFEKRSVKIPFKYEPSVMNDLIMLGRAFTKSYLDGNNMVITSYLPQPEIQNPHNI